MATAIAKAKLEVKGTIRLVADEFKQFNALKAEIAACEREKRFLIEKWETESGLPVADAKHEGEYVIVNGNGDEIGKVTVAFRDGYEVKPGYRRTIS